MELHVFSNNTGDLVVAHSEADAFAALCVHNGWQPSDDDARDADSFALVPDEHVITITFEDELEDEPDKKGIEGLERHAQGKWWFKCSTTAADWVRRFGRSYIGSTEY